MTSRKLTVEEFMSTALVTARSDETIDDADFEMKLSEIRHLPIVDAHNRLAGIVSQRDLLRALARSKKRPVPIRAIMTTRVHSVRADAPAIDAVNLMLDHKIGCVPVLGEDGQLVGLVTETDFLRFTREILLGRTPVASARRAS
jgi:CBS domain-containing protein